MLNGMNVMLRSIASFIALLLIGFGLTSILPIQFESAQASQPISVYAKTRKEIVFKDPPGPAITGYVYTAKIQEGKVYLWLANNPDPRMHIGPFVKKSDTEYKLITEGRGVQSVWKDSGRWLYIDNHVQMAPLPVDGSVLEK